MIVFWFKQVESKEKLLELSRKLEKATRLRETSERELMERKSQNKMAPKEEVLFTIEHPQIN